MYTLSMFDENCCLPGLCITAASTELKEFKLQAWFKIVTLTISLLKNIYRVKNGKECCYRSLINDSEKEQTSWCVIEELERALLPECSLKHNPPLFIWQIYSITSVFIFTMLIFLTVNTANSHNNARLWLDTQGYRTCFTSSSHKTELIRYLRNPSWPQSFVLDQGKTKMCNWLESPELGLRTSVVDMAALS